jgi:hypothetical protein
VGLAAAVIIIIIYLFSIMISYSSNCSYLSNPLSVTPFLPSFL